MALTVAGENVILNGVKNLCATQNDSALFLNRCARSCQRMAKRMNGYARTHPFIRFTNPLTTRNGDYQCHLI